VQLAATQREGGIQAVFDYPLYYAMTDVFCRDAAPARLASILALDRLYVDPQQLVTFLDNHDVARVASSCGGDRDRVEKALTFLFATRGIPSLTYGTEVMLEGQQEPDNRADMPWERVGEVGLAPLVSDLAALRSRTPALAHGDTRVLGVGPQWLVIARVAGRSVAVIAVNQGTRAVRWTPPDGLMGADLVERWPARETSASRWEIPADSTEVWVLRAGNDALVANPPLHVPVAMRTVRFVVGPQMPGVRVCGAGPELGAWDPASAPAVGAAGVLEVSVPVGTVLAWKVVTVAEDGTASWESGGNRYLPVPSGSEALSVPVVPRSALEGWPLPP
jgi:hypothetical protein